MVGRVPGVAGFPAGGRGGGVAGDGWEDGGGCEPVSQEDGEQILHPPAIFSHPQGLEEGCGPSQTLGERGPLAFPGVENKHARRCDFGVAMDAIEE